MPPVVSPYFSLGFGFLIYEMSRSLSKILSGPNVLWFWRVLLAKTCVPPLAWTLIPSLTLGKSFVFTEPLRQCLVLQRSGICCLSVNQRSHLNEMSWTVLNLTRAVAGVKPTLSGKSQGKLSNSQISVRNNNILWHLSGAAEFTSHLGWKPSSTIF